MDSSRTNFTQNIHFKGSESEYSADIIAQDVTIHCYSGGHNNGSSKVKLTNVVDYQWEAKYYKGHLIAIHMEGQVIAYGIKGKVNGMIRVANPDTNQRALIKDIKGLVQDLAFAFIPSQIILACIDEEGNLFVYNINNTPDSISCDLLIHIVHKDVTYNSKLNFRVLWCPYVPLIDNDSDSTEEAAKFLVCLNGNRAEVWDIDIVSSKYGVGPLESTNRYEGYVQIDDHSLEVIDASLSPDGTAIATASLDGFVKFFQVQACMVDGEKPKCLHQWQPHGGKPLSCLFFLDNVNAIATDSKFWKFAITGANNDTEIKVWSCESWTCLQTIHFKHNRNSTGSDILFKTRLDLTANYLFMSDITNKILYILQIQKNDAERVATISCISEFLLPSPFLSFGIISAGECELKTMNSTEDLYQEESNMEDYDEERNVTGTVVKMYVVQPKSLQICSITFKSANSMSNMLYPNMLDNNTDPKKSKINLIENNISDLEDLQSSVSLLIQQQNKNNHQNLQQQSNPNLNLMSPADFTENLTPTKGSPLLNDTSTKSNFLEQQLDMKVENLIDFQQPQKETFTSGGSSPSREVQEILSLKNPQDYLESLVKLEIEDSQSKEASFSRSKEGSNEINVWPNVPMMKVLDIETKEGNLNQNLQFSNEENVDKNNWNNSDINFLLYKINILERSMQENNNLLKKILQEKKHTSKLDCDIDIKNLIGAETSLAVNKICSHITQTLEIHLKEQKRKDLEIYEHLINNITQAFNLRVTEAVQKVLIQELKTVIQPSIASEIKNVVLPSILATFEKLHHQLDLHYSQKLNTIDQLLKNNISKLVSSKVLADSISSSVLNIIKPSLEQCYKDMISTTLIPSWERICNSMFQQIHTTFTQGTKEYTSSVETYMEKQRKVQDKNKDLVGQMMTLTESLKMNSEKLSTNVTEEIQKQLTVAFSGFQERILYSISEQVKEQIKNGFKAHALLLEDSVANAVRSRAVTPSLQTVDSQVYAQLDHLLANGNIDTAFQQALSASSSVHDVRYVIYICEQVNPQDIFGMTQEKGNCILQQNVLLSLIQQLSTELTRKTEIKLRYLQEAILTLETDNPLTKKHMPSVLSSLLTQINSFIANNPTHKNVKGMRMLQMATQSLL